MIANGVLALIGLPMIGFSSNVGVRYTGVFLATAASNANVPAVLTWQANNIRGQWKRALCSATLVGAGGVGGIIGGTVFRSQDAPGYVPGIVACLVAAVVIVLTAAVLDIKFYFANKRVARGGKPIEGLYIHGAHLDAHHILVPVVWLKVRHALRLLNPRIPHHGVFQAIADDIEAWLAVADDGRRVLLDRLVDAVGFASDLEARG